MHELTITYAGMHYPDRIGPLIDGTVRPAGISFRYTYFPLSDLFRRVAQQVEFDVAEMSSGTYMNLVSRGDDRYTAIPVFLSRMFRHRFIFVHANSGIGEPRDLIGRDVGIFEYQMTASMWQRAFLMHDYGVQPQAIRWHFGGLWEPGYLDRNPIPTPPGVSLEPIPADKSLFGMLADGELDALLSPQQPPAFNDGTGRVRRLFPNFVEVEQDYYRRTGFFPIMHLVVVRRDLYRQHPWIIPNLLQAFGEAQRIGWQRLTQSGALWVMLPWLARDFEEIRAAMGPKHWPYGLQENYQILDAMCEYHFEQGLSERRLRPEELFAPEAHETPILGPIVV